MLENKIEELRSSSVEHKNPSQPPLVMGGVQTYTKIDLNIPIFIDNSFFSSELDKINFYREIESLESIEDLQSFITDFKETQVNASPLTRLPK
jgi:transcription-repair coupling factor (superfamily II helicase)